MRFSKTRAFFFVLGCLSWPVLAQQPAEYLIPLKQSLMTALGSALPSGTDEALNVCRVQAQTLTAAAQPEGVQIGRTSDRLRNPDNVAPEWVEPLLDLYVAGDLTQPVQVPLASGGVGYVEPILVAEVCTQCHGTALADAVSSLLQQHYPMDQAIGYSVGDFRGLFWVAMPR